MAWRIAMGVRWLASGVVASVAALGGGPASTSAQEASPASVVSTLGLDRGEVGRVVIHYLPEDEARARDLAAHVDGAAQMFESELGLTISLALAALGPDNWFSEFPGVPYAIPWVSVPEGLLILPSSLEVGLLASGPDRLANERRTDFVALHEYGHVAAKEFFRPASPASYLSVSWFDELVATYFAYSYVAATDEEWAAAARIEWRSQVDGFDPVVRSLDWSFMNELSGPEVAENYAWYQFLLNLRASELHDRYGVELLGRLKSALDWGGAAEWTSESLQRDLESTMPDFISWARGFGGA